MTSPLIDSHAHLDMLDDPAAALEQARQAGVVQVVTIGIDLTSSRAAARLAAEHEEVFHTVGVYPHDAGKTDQHTWSQLKRLAHRGGAVAIGECGLDYFRNYSPKQDQRRAFARQIELALELGLPLVIHDRDAHQEVARTLRESGAEKVGGIVHCFSGDLAMAEQVLELGFHLGVTGTITFPKNQALRDLVKRVPPERLVVETDCPFLTPVPHRGRPNQPAYVRYAAQELARCLEMSEDELCRLVCANTRRVLGLPEPGA